MIHTHRVKSILNKTKHRDSWFLGDYTLNVFSGCPFNCQYCYVKGSKYGQHLEKKVSVKENALELLDKALKLRSHKGQYGYIVMSSATDPYIQIESELKITRSILELIMLYRFPVHIITKGTSVARDFDLLTSISSNAILPKDLTHLPGSLITFSFSTLNPELARIMEPGAPNPQERLDMLENAVRHGFHAGVSLMPLLPYLSDTPDELNKMFNQFTASEAKYIFSAGLSLFGHGAKEAYGLVMNNIQKNFPELLSRYEKLFNDNSYNYQYNKKLQARLNALSTQYNIPSRLNS